ncbi:MAG: metallophosphoesterase [Mycobacteriaceae bacterium]
MAKYDIIGDIHGYAEELKALLAQLGYRRDDAGVYRHPERTAVFVGDLVDRGPGQLEVLQIVKAMVEQGGAHIVMGNHEFNAIAYATPNPNAPGDFLRTRKDPKNTTGHAAFLALTHEQQKDYLDWFKTIPLWLDLGGIRVVHACWNPESMTVVEAATGGNMLTDLQHYVDASTKGHPLYEAVETLLKGPEIDLVQYGQQSYIDHGGKARNQARLRWWDADAHTLRTLADVRGMKTEDGQDYPALPDLAVDPALLSYVYTDTVPVIYGHYWFEWDNHRDDWTDYTACVDYSVAKDAGKLVAYRWDGEPTINWRNYAPHTRDVVAETPSG